MVSKEEILQEKELYWKSVLFFAAFSKHLSSKRVEHKIEHEVKGNDGNPKNPDFILLERNKINYVLEHKASLPINQEFALKLLEETEKKYSKINYEGKDFTPFLIMLCPKTCEEVINKIKKLNKTNVSICVFNLDIENGEISFLFDEDKYPKFIKELLSGELPFRNDEFSKYKFIKKEPHPVYTAWVVWSIILNYFKDPYTIKKDSIMVRYDPLIDQASTLFPSWIEDAKQITKTRINNALDFLNKIGFVSWKKGSQDIEFFHNKGSRIGDIFEYFAKNFIKFIKVTPKKELKEQKGLAEFI